VFLFLSGRRDGAFRVIPVTSDSGLLVSRPLRLALSSLAVDEFEKNNYLLKTGKRKGSSSLLVGPRRSQE